MTSKSKVASKIPITTGVSFNLQSCTSATAFGKIRIYILYIIASFLHQNYAGTNCLVQT